MAEEPVHARGDQPAMRWHQSERSPKGCQAHDSNHNPYPLEEEPSSVQPPSVRTARTKQRCTERAEISGDPHGNTPAHQCGRSTNAEQHGRPDAKNPDPQSDHAARFDRVTDVDDGE